MDYTSRLRAIIDRLAGDQVLPTGVTLAGGDLLDTPATFHSHTGGNPAAGSAGGSIAPRKQPPAHRLTAHEAKQFLADAFESLTRRDRVAMLYGVLSRELTDDELIRLSNMLGRVPHERART